MPCTYDEPGPTTISQGFDKYQQKLNKLTRLLCETMTTLDTMQHQAKGAYYPLTDVLASVDGLSSWWNQHLLADRARKEKEEAFAKQEALKQAALSKLTAEEAKALGILK